MNKAVTHDMMYTSTIVAANCWFNLYESGRIAA